MIFSSFTMIYAIEIYEQFVVTETDKYRLLKQCSININALWRNCGKKLQQKVLPKCLKICWFLITCWSHMSDQKQSSILFSKQFRLTELVHIHGTKKRVFSDFYEVYLKMLMRSEIPAKNENQLKYISLQYIYSICLRSEIGLHEMFISLSKLQNSAISSGFRFQE